MLAGWLVCYLLVAVKNIGIVRRFNSSPIPTFVSVRNGAFPRDWLNLSEHCDHLSVVLRAACVSVCLCLYSNIYNREWRTAVRRAFCRFVHVHIVLAVL